MGMLSKAMKKQKEKTRNAALGEKQEQITITGSVTFPDGLAIKLHEVSEMRGISVQDLVIAKMTALCNQYENSRILRLTDTMPYGQYRGLIVEDMIRADPRYVNWLASESSIFALEDEALALLEELS